LPPDIADVADGMRQKALLLAGDASKIEDNATHERLEQIKIENEIRAQSFVLREKEIDALARALEKAIADSHEHVILLLNSLAREQTTTRAQQKPIANPEAQLEKYRQHLTVLISRAPHGRPSAQKAPVVTSSLMPGANRPRTIVHESRARAPKRRDRHLGASYGVPNRDRYNR
jgi:hypothetical protein